MGNFLATPVLGKLVSFLWFQIQNSSLCLSFIFWPCYGVFYHVEIVKTINFAFYTSLFSSLLTFLLFFKYARYFSSSCSLCLEFSSWRYVLSLPPSPLWVFDQISTSQWYLPWQLILYCNLPISDLFFVYHLELTDFRGICLFVSYQIVAHLYKWIKWE